MTFSIRRLSTNIGYSMVLFFRDWQTVFLAFIFPTLIFVIIGSVFTAVQDKPLLNITYDTDVNTLFPGIVGICIMFAALNWTIGAISRYRSNGVFQKLTTTPLTGFEWNISWIIMGMLIVLLSVLISFVSSWLAFGVLPVINLISLITVIAGAFIFTGIGMTMAYLIEDPDAAGSASYAMIIPMILISGSLFPVERLPSFIQFFSILSPLTYLNNCLRCSMLTGDLASAFVNLVILAFFGLIIYCIGVAVMMGKEGQDV